MRRRGREIITPAGHPIDAPLRDRLDQPTHEIRRPVRSHRQSQTYQSRMRRALIADILYWAGTLLCGIVIGTIATLGWYGPPWPWDDGPTLRDPKPAPTVYLTPPSDWTSVTPIPSASQPR